MATGGAFKQFAVGIVAALWAHGAQAVEKKPIQVTDRWSVVGVIAGDDAQGKDIGIAVLKNNETRRTYTVSLGETLPSDYKFTLHAVIGREVTVSDGDKTYVLGYAESSMAEENEEREAPTYADTTRASRFLDTYYRSFDDVPADAAGQDMERPGYNAPLQRFSTLREQAARSRFELFRAERPYGANPDEPTDVGNESDGFVVNYDNFTDEGATEASGEAAGTSWSDQEYVPTYEPVEEIVTE